MIVDLTGAYDLHLHTAPSLFPRLGDDKAIAEHALSMGLAGIILKSHHGSTVARAYTTQKALNDEIKVFGSIVLNSYVGGINPDAVEVALKLGAKTVWMPTIEAAYHGKKHGGTGAFDVQKPKNGFSAKNSNPPKGITILDENGKLIPQLKDVLSLIKEYDVSLGTGHLSPEEIFALVKSARAIGIKKIQLTHPFFKVPDLTLNQTKELVEMGVYAEFAYCSVSPMWDYTTIAKVSEAIKTVGAKNTILVSDGGQTHNPMPAESLRIFAQCMYESGISQEQINMMIKENPAYLMGQ
jgi:hypothetical protein